MGFVVQIVDLLLRKSEVAQILRVSVQTVGRLLARGELESQRVGARFVRITKSSLDAYLERKGGVK